MTADEDMRRDRTGEVPVQLDGDQAHGCENGWWGEDSDGRPRPCYTCRPHLRRSEIEKRLPQGGRRRR